MLRVGRNRTKNTRLPKGWVLGPVAKATGVRTIYFRPTNAGDATIVKKITGGPLSLRLGATHDEAAERYAKLIVAERHREENAVPGTVAELAQRARLELLPTIASKKTKSERSRHIEALDKAFGTKRYARNVFEASRDMSGVFLRAMDVQRHVFNGKASRPVGVNREIRTWEIVFQWARAVWGLTEYNPCNEVTPNPEAPRDVLPEDDQIFKLYRRLDPPARFMVALNRYYGRRKIEALGLQLSSAQKDGLHLRRGKRAKEIVILWDSRLERMWRRLMKWRDEVKRGGKVEELSAAILNRRGRRYTESGFNSARKRAMERAGIEGAFTFHDLRSTRASTLDREKAVEVLAHDDARTTNRIYRRGAHVVDLRAEVNARRKPK